MKIFIDQKETLEKREPYWDLVDKKAEENNSIDLDVYAKGVQDGAKYMQKICISKDAYEDSLNIQICSNNGYQSKIYELKNKIKQMYNKKDMIDFAEFVASYPDKNRNHKSEMLHAKSKYDGAERTIDLLEIWLKESKTK